MANPSALEMSSHDRFSAIFAHREADRIPIIDSPWEATVERWQKEGLPADTSYVDYFGLDNLETLWLDNSPRFEEKLLEETEEHVVYTSSWGVTMKQWKHAASTPQFLNFTITSPEQWQEARRRMIPSRERIKWERLDSDFRRWKDKGCWIQAGLWFGFDVTHSWIVGTERVLMALVDEPRWLMDMFECQLETNLALLDMVWAAGYRFDSVFWYDDMGYKNHQFFSMRTYRNVLKPFHQRAIDWAHAKGIRTHLHSCGDVNPFVPELIAMGLDALNPIEVKAGMDPVYLKKTYGRDLILHGGINAVLWDQPEALLDEMERVVPVLMESGGYIFSSDHSVPSSVSLETFRTVIQAAKELGSYR